LLSLAISSNDLYSNLRWIRDDLAILDVLSVDLLTNIVDISNLSVGLELLGNRLGFTLAVH